MFTIDDHQTPLEILNSICNIRNSRFTRFICKITAGARFPLLKHDKQLPVNSRQSHTLQPNVAEVSTRFQSKIDIIII